MKRWIAVLLVSLPLAATEPPPKAPNVAGEGLPVDAGPAQPQAAPGLTPPEHYEYLKRVAPLLQAQLDRCQSASVPPAERRLEAQVQGLVSELGRKYRLQGGCRLDLASGTFVCPPGASQPGTSQPGASEPGASEPGPEAARQQNDGEPADGEQD